MKTFLFDNKRWKKIFEKNRNSLSIRKLERCHRNISIIVQQVSRIAFEESQMIENNGNDKHDHNPRHTRYNVDPEGSFRRCSLFDDSIGIDDSHGKSSSVEWTRPGRIHYGLEYKGRVCCVENIIWN